MDVTKLYERFLTLPIPTKAVINGHAYAGGLILSLMHDFRIMAKGKSKLCFSELAVKMPMMPPYTALVKATIPI